MDGCDSMLFFIFFRYLRDTLHFIDKRRVAVWGWSYGGFVAALSLAKSSDIFHCGISVAPVTNWALYGELRLKQNKHVN